MYLIGVLPVNAAEQARNIELTSKIAAVVNLFKSEFPDAKLFFNYLVTALFPIDHSA